jgi:Flp pilus assembly protein TadG
MPPTRRGRRRLAGDRGAVTVETAIALTAFVMVLALAFGAISAAIDQLRCIDAAREAARLVARGEDVRARTAAAQIAPDDAEIAITVREDTVQVDVRTAPLSGLLPGLRLHGDAYAIAEPASSGSIP